MIDTAGIGKCAISFFFISWDPHTKIKETDNMGKEIAGKATATQQVIQTTILISIFPWQDTFMQKREEAEMSIWAHL